LVGFIFFHASSEPVSAEPRVYVALTKLQLPNSECDKRPIRQADLAPQINIAHGLAYKIASALQATEPPSFDVDWGYTKNEGGKAGTGASNKTGSGTSKTNNGASNKSGSGAGKTNNGASGNSKLQNWRSVAEYIPEDKRPYTHFAVGVLSAECDGVREVLSISWDFGSVTLVDNQPKLIFTLSLKDDTVSLRIYPAEDRRAAGFRRNAEALPTEEREVRDNITATLNAYFPELFDVATYYVACFKPQFPTLPKTWTHSRLMLLQRLWHAIQDQDNPNNAKLRMYSHLGESEAEKLCSIEDETWASDFATYAIRGRILLTPLGPAASVAIDIEEEVKLRRNAVLRRGTASIWLEDGQLKDLRSVEAYVQMKKNIEEQSRDPNIHLPQTWCSPPDDLVGPNPDLSLADSIGRYVQARLLNRSQTFHPEPLPDYWRCKADAR
jgi:hypothetical protein